MRSLNSRIKGNIAYKGCGGGSHKSHKSHKSWKCKSRSSRSRDW